MRELLNTLKYAVIRCTGEVLTPDCLPPLRGTASSAVPASATAAITPAALRFPDLAAYVKQHLSSGTMDVYAHVIAEADRVILHEVLQQTQGNLRLASEVLGISRTTLRSKLNQLGLAVSKQVLSESDRSGQ